MAQQWIDAATALRIATNGGSATAAQMRICQRAHAGLIAARARLVRHQGIEEENKTIPKGFWWAEGNLALEQDWAVGDFSTWIDGKHHIQVFGVEFDLADIVQLIPADSRGSALAQLSVAGNDNWIAANAAVRLLAPSALRPARSAEQKLIEAARLGFVAVCADNPHGVMVARDELLTLFAELDREEKTSARGFFLTGWAGMDGYTFDRIGRGRTHCPAINLSLFGTTQPTRLTGYMRQSLASMNDGMVQRLQLLTWPDLGGEFREVDRYPDSDAKAAAFACYDRLAALDARLIGADMDAFGSDTAFPFLRFDDDAQEGFADWRSELERKVRGDDLPPAFIAHLSKYRGLIPRLALLCHLASGGFGPVTLKAAAMAWRWSDYLEAHAWRAYSSLGVANADTARAIWRKVKRDQLPRPFTARDIYRNGWSGLSDKPDVTAGLATLVDSDWIIAQEVQTGGRPSTVYVPNPLALAR